MGALDRVFRGRRGGQDRPLAAQVASLFANGEQGLWYDIESFRDAWNNVGPELLANGDFSAGAAGWAAGAGVAITTGKASFSSTSAGVGITQAASAPYVSGDWYEVTLTISNYVSGSLSARLGGSGAFTVLPAGNGTKSVLVLATGSTTSAAFLSTASGVTLDVVLVSVKRWLGLPSCALFQDATGTLPAYMPGQGQVDPPVGLLFDRRKGMTRGPELLSNGDFSEGSTKWGVANSDATHIATFAGGTLRYQSDTTSPVMLVSQVGVPIVAGRWYEVTITVSSWSSGGIKTDTLNGNAASGLTLAQGAGTFRSIGLATASTSSFGFSRSSANVDLTIDSISVREVLGNHAFQVSTPSRITLSARYNGLLASEKFNDATWTWRASFTSELTSDVTAPDGTNTAWKITSLAANAALSKAGLTGYKNPVFTLWCKAGTWNPRILVRNATTATNLISGSLGNADTTSTYGKFSSADLGGGWKRLRIEITSGVSVTDALIVYAGATGAVPVGQYLYLWRVDLRDASDGVGLPEYQRVVDASTYDTAGFPLYLKIDGLDDGLQIPAVDFSASDKIMLVAAIRRMSDSGLGAVLEATADYSTSNGTFVLLAPGASGTPSVGFNAKGTTVTGGLSYTTSAAPVGLVVSAYADIAASVRLLRVNGAQVASSTTSIGTGSFGNAPLFIGRRNGASLPFNGRLYGLLLRGAASNDGTFARVERYLNQKGRVA